MKSTALFWIICLFLSTVLAMLAYLISTTSSSDREKLSPFECGFDPIKSARTPFSLRFFLITILFLIFDVEVALLLPLEISLHFIDPSDFTLISVSLIALLLIGLLHEWNQGALSWVP